MALMATMYIRRAYCEVVLGNVDRPYTVPAFTDSSAALAFTKSEKESKRSRHIERRFQFSRYAEQNSFAKLHHIDGDNYMVADIGTKPKATEEVAYKLSISKVRLLSMLKMIEYSIKEECWNRWIHCL